MRIYCAERYGWIDEVFDMVSWDMVGRVQRKLTHTKRMQNYAWVVTNRTHAAIYHR